MKSVLRKIKRAATAMLATAEERERHRLAMIPRYQATTTNLPGAVWNIPDGPSFLASWEEIFDKRVYLFHQPGKTPARILDCGANVGVSCLYFHRHFPGAKITAFEPDPKIFSYLQRNLDASGSHGIELIRKAVWSAETTLRFHSEGSDGGRVETSGGSDTIEIPAVRLRDFLSEPVDLLKLDIEGAETEVLLDIVPCLGRVRNLFVEYHSFGDRPQTLGVLIQTLTDAGFRVHLHPMNCAAQPFMEIPTSFGMDLQLNIFARRDHSGQ